MTRRGQSQIKTLCEESWAESNEFFHAFLLKYKHYLVSKFDLVLLQHGTTMSLVVPTYHVGIYKIWFIGKQTKKSCLVTLPLKYQCYYSK